MVGSNTIPTVPMFAFSGFACGLPPMVELICWLGSPLPATLLPGAPWRPPTELQRAPSVVLDAACAQGSPAGSALGAWPPYRSEMFGARKPVPYVPRMVTSRMGRHRPPILYVQSDPKVE